MNDFFKIADKYLKPVTIGAGVVLGLAVTYAAGSYLSSVSKLAGGFYTFMYVLFWIAFVLLVICGIYTLFKKYAGSVPQQNAQQTYAQPQAQAAPQGEKFCPACGGKVPAGNQFCPNCGNKIN